MYQMRAFEGRGHTGTYPVVDILKVTPSRAECGDMATTVTAACCCYMCYQDDNDDEAHRSAVHVGQSQPLSTLVKCVN